MLLRQIGRLSSEFAGDPHDAAFTKNGLEHDGGCLVAHGCFQPLQMIRVDELHVGNQRLEGLAVLRLARDGDRPESTAREGVVERDDLGLVRAPRTPVALGDLERRLDGLGPAVAEIRPVKPAHPRELFGQGALIGVGIEVRAVHQGAGLIANCLDHPRVAVAEGVDSDAGNEVEVLLALIVVDVAALTPHKNDLSATVVLEEMTIFKCADLRGVVAGMVTH